MNVCCLKALDEVCLDARWWHVGKGSRIRAQSSLTAWILSPISGF